MSQAANKKKKRLGREELTLNLMILPGMIILIIFVFAPLVGSLMAFENYVPGEMTKINNPVLVTKGTTVVLVLADDTASVSDQINELLK